MILLFVVSKRVSRAQRVKEIEIDSSLQLKYRDIFRDKFWLLIASRQGVLMAAILRSLFYGAIIGGVFALLNLLGILNTPDIFLIGRPIIVTIGTFIWYYGRYS